MAGYSRQSAADIIASAIIRAAPVNAEYNAIRDAFAFATGHKHDGSSTEGAYIPLIADTDAKNKVVVDTTNNRISVYSEVGGAAVEQLRIQDGAIVPVTDDDVDLGASGAEFKDLYIDGIGYIDTLAVHENATIAGTLNVTGVITAPGGLVADITGDITGNVTGDLTGDVTSTGTSTFADLDAVDLAATGTTVITSGDINSGTIDNSVIGNATPAAGTFTTLNANTSLTAATADIDGGTVDGTTIGATSHTTGKFTTLESTGTATLATVDINAGNIDGTVIGASSAAAGSFTTVSTSGQATLATVDINGGNIDGAIIGATTAAAITGTTITGTSLVGPVTGNVTGNLTGNVTGDVTGDLTGNVTASSGSSTFNNVVIDGTLNMNAGTTATIQNLTAPLNDLDAATKKYVDDEVAGLVDSAPGTLDTLNELAAALGDDADFSNTVTTSIATKLPLAGGTMTGAIAMGTNKITGLGDPTAAQDAASKNYSDTTFLGLSGGTMTGAIDMGSQKITTTYTPTNAADLTTKTYVDAILGSGSDAAASAAAAATSETNAATSATNAATSETNAATSEANAAASYDNFDDRYLGAKSSAPTVDNDGDALIVGALYFNSTTNIMYVYSSGGWQAAGSSVNGTSDRSTYTATAGQTVFAATYDTGYVDVYLNGVKLVAGTDFTATNGTSITLTSGAAVNDVVDIVAYGTFVLADHYTEAQSDARYVEVAGDTMTGNLDVQGTVTADGLTVDGATSLNASITQTSVSPSFYIMDSNTTDLNDRFVNAGGTFFLQTVNDAKSTFKSRFSVNNSTGDISFYEDTGSTPKFHWSAADESLGIGTTSPSAKIDVVGSTENLLELTSSGSFGTAINITQNTPSTSIFVNSTSTGDIVDFRDNGTTVFTVKDGGNVGIGTSSPSGKLELYGSGISDLPLVINHAWGSSSTALISASAASSEVFKVERRGHVGIGTSSPTTALTVSTDGTEQLTINRADASINPGNTVGTILFTGDDPSANQTGARIQVIASQNWSSNAYGSHITFSNDNSGTITERMRIDSSGNLLVGKTSSSFSTEGIEAKPDHLQVIRDGDVSLYLNRLTSDGDIARFYKDGSTVGSIGTSGVDLTIGTGDVGLKFNDASNRIDPWNVTTNTSVDGAFDLGKTDRRFKDLYLSGGVYLGGTGSANKLDDYESGTWTPSMATEGGTNYTLSTANGYYRKVGSLVHVEADITFTAEGSGTITLISLPFTPRGNTEIINGYVTSGVSRRSIQLTHYSGANVLVRVDDGSAFTNYWSTRSVWSPTNSFRFAGTYIDNS